MCTLDALLQDHTDRIGLIKMDVGGYECEVVAGGREAILHDRPIVRRQIEYPEKWENTFLHTSRPFVGAIRVTQARHEGHLNYEAASIAVAIPSFGRDQSSLTRSLGCCSRVNRRLKSLFLTRVLITAPQLKEPYWLGASKVRF